MSNSKLLLTFIFSLIGGAAVFNSLIDEDRNQSFVTSAVVISASSSRTPASESIDHQIQSKHSDFNLDFGCKNELKSLSSHQRLVQFKGKICVTNGKKFRQISAITNQTNKVTASVFNLDPNRFESDIFSLSKGENEIEVVVGSGADSTKYYLKIKAD